MGIVMGPKGTNISTNGEINLTNSTIINPNGIVIGKVGPNGAIYGVNGTSSFTDDKNNTSNVGLKCKVNDVITMSDVKKRRRLYNIINKDLFSGVNKTKKFEIMKHDANLESTPTSTLLKQIQKSNSQLAPNRPSIAFYISNLTCFNIER